MDRYRKDGPGVTTRLLAELLTDTDALDGTLLDVGSGIGALTFELLARGVVQATAVDASSAYLSVAAREAVTRGRSADIQFVEGDFLDLAANVPAATVVALDRVICCHPMYERLLEESLGHARRSFAFSYPRDVWYVRLGVAFENALRRLRGNPFRTFVHSAARMRQIVEGAGFTRSARRRTWQWVAEVYARSHR